MNPNLPDRLRVETERLRRSWSRHPAEMLREYMVAGIHDPWINPQSIHSRHLVLETAFPGRFEALKREELRFALAMNWLLPVLRDAIIPEELEALAHALELGADDAEGLSIPHWLLDIRSGLPREVDGAMVADPVLETVLDARRMGPSAARARGHQRFAAVWRQVLRDEPVAGLDVLEAGCGSANDYRAMESCGLVRHLRYLGVDLCEANIVNARALFPGARFEVGNLLELGHGDGEFGCTVVHDVLEHLSLEACDMAVAELARVSREGVFIGFFQMHEGEDDVVREVDDYHWNTLSLPRMRRRFALHGWRAEATHVASWLRWAGGPEAAYYETAYDLILAREVARTT